VPQEGERAAKGTNKEDERLTRRGNDSVRGIIHEAHKVIDIAPVVHVWGYAGGFLLR
jgi:hypothetical protein